MEQKKQTKNEKYVEKKYSLYYKLYGCPFHILLKNETYEKCFLHVVYLEQMNRFITYVNGHEVVYANHKHCVNYLSRVSFVFGDVHFDSLQDCQYLILEEMI